MPFTFAHPAAVLPFKKFSPKYFSATGLLAGSVVPDFEYFIYFRDSMQWSHYWWGIFCFDLPVGLVLCFLFHNLVRDSLIANGPFLVYRKFAGYVDFNWNRYFANRWLSVIVSLLLGSALHILWDALTHFLGDAVLKTGMASNIEPSLRGLLIYYSIWSLNSLLGFIALAACFYRLPDTGVYLKRGRSKYWTLTVLTAFSVIAIRLIINSNLTIIDGVDTCISAALIGIILSSIIYQEQLRRKKSASQGIAR